MPPPQLTRVPRGFPVTVQVGPSRITIGALLLADAVDALAGGQWTEWIPGAVTPDDWLMLTGRLWDDTDPLDSPHLAGIVRAVMLRATGVPWQSAVILAATARAHWVQLRAWGHGHGVAVDGLELGAFFAAVWAWLQSTVADEKAWRELDRRVWPPTRETRASTWRMARQQMAATRST